LKKIPVNFITLKFDSEILELQYRRSSVKQALKVIRLSLILGCTLVSVFGILDLWMVPDHLWTVWGIRLTLDVVMLIVYILSFQNFYRNNGQTLMSIVTIVLGIGITGMVLISDTEGGYFYYAGLMLVIQFAHGLTRLSFINATISTIIIALAYLFIAWGIKSTPTEIIINNSFFLFSTIIIGMFISYSLEFYIRGNFWQRINLAHQENLLKSEFYRKTKELDKIRQLQLAILPKKVLEHPTIELAVSSRTAAEVGGDYYDYCIDGSGRISFAIGDATGHGAQAGALVTAAKVMFSCWSEDEDVTKFINHTSKTIKQLGLPQLFMAMVAGKIDNNKIEFAGSGLPPALIHKAITGTLEEIPLKGFPLGCVASYEYKKNCVMLNRGDTLLFMTDGFPELFNSNKDLLGYEKIKNAFCEVVNETPDKIVNYLKRMIDNWCDGFPLQDDVTFLLFKVKSHNDKAKQIIYNKF
jgi:serine phosphatase RsbU (regulator of sigma subunit)